MFDGPENFDGEKKIADMLSSLRRVDAPGDFNTRVRARIARGDVVSTTSWTTSLIRVAAPLAAAIVVAVGGYFVFTSINTDQNVAPTVADVQPQTKLPVAEQPPSNIEASQPTNRTTIKPNEELVAQNNNPASINGSKLNGPNSVDQETPKDQPTGGSKELAVREAQKLFPRGINPHAKVPTNAKGVDPSTRLHVSSILEFIGVKATWAGGGWRVDSVDANNIASRSGIQTGDVVEAINGQTVDNKTTFSAKFEGKSVRVRRDGASLSIDFKP